MGFILGDINKYSITFFNSFVESSDQSWKDVGMLQGEIVVRPEHVAGNNRRVSNTVLSVVSAVQHVQHPFGVTVAKIRYVRRPVMNLLTAG